MYLDEVAVEVEGEEDVDSDVVVTGSEVLVQGAVVAQALFGHEVTVTTSQTVRSAAGAAAARWHIASIHPACAM